MVVRGALAAVLIGALLVVPTVAAPADDAAPPAPAAPADDGAPPADCYMAGYLLMKELGDRKRGTAVLRQLVDRFPADVHAEHARQLLEQLDGQA